jgi:hypothetical protein
MANREPHSPAIAEIGDVRTPVIGGNFVSALNELDRAWFSIPMDNGLELEYLAPVKVEIDGHVMIEGSVVAAFPAGTTVEIFVQSAVAMSEESMHGWLLQNVRTQDGVYAAARMAGFDRDHITIAELDEIPTEVFEVVVGIDGVSPSGATGVGAVTFVAVDQARKVLSQFDPEPEWASEFEDAPGYAVAYVTSKQMYDAQVEALAQIELALSWLTTRTRYGMSSLPDGTLHRFERTESHAAPKMRDLVALRGMSTTRRWIQRLGPRRRASPLSMGGRSRIADPSLPRRVPFELRQAMLSAQRAIGVDDPIQRSQALWESLEFYLAGRPTPGLLSVAERKNLLRVMRSSIAQEHHQRVADLLNWIDRPPPKTMLRNALAEDSIPVSDAEFELLFKVRRARNKATHGGQVDVPSDEELDHACSLLSRILVHRLDALGGGYGGRLQVGPN